MTWTDEQIKLVRELKNDKARLDWLDKALFHGWRFERLSQGTWCYMVSPNGYSINGETVRDAIDAARTLAQ